MRTTKLAASLLVLLALVLGAAPARAETVDCMPITALPAVITVQGIYCFTGNLATAITSGAAIEIQTNNVVLDLNGFKLGGLGAGPGTGAFGIHALNRQNITIKNGTIRGFFKGILLETAGASQGHLVEDIRADQNTFVGIHVEGSGNIVRNNQMVATGGSTGFGPNADAAGIFVSGNGPRVLNNDVINTVKQGTGVARGIFLNGVSGALAVNNRITGADRGIEFNGTGKYRDNLTFDVTTPYTGGTEDTNAFTIGGTVSGLSGTVVLQNNGGDNLTVSVNGSFTFATALANSSAYNVTVLTQPAGQTCTVTNGAGTVSGADVTNVTVTCAAWAPSDFEALPITLDTVSAAVSIWTGSQELEIPSSCGGSPAIACPNGVPTSPAPRLALARSSTTVTQTADSMTFSSQVSLVSVTDIPMTFSGTECLVHIDTAFAAPPTVQISGTAVFDALVPLGTINRLDATNVLVTDLAVADISVSGSPACAISTSFAGVARTAISTLLQDMINSRRLCGAPGPALFAACPFIL